MLDFAMRIFQSDFIEKSDYSCGCTLLSTQSNLAHATQVGCRKCLHDLVLGLNIPCLNHRASFDMPIILPAKVTNSHWKQHVTYSVLHIKYHWEKYHQLEIHHFLCHKMATLCGFLHNVQGNEMKPFHQMSISWKMYSDCMQALILIFTTEN